MSGSKKEEVWTPIFDKYFDSYFFTAYKKFELLLLLSSHSLVINK